MKRTDDESVSRLVEHAKREFHALGMLNDRGKEDLQMQRNILELLRVLARQGHNGGSVTHLMSMFGRLAAFEPLCPLIGDDAEWTEVEDGLWQNIRCPHVFKGADDRAYDIDGRIFRRPGGICYRNRDSWVYIEFPYMPTTEYVDV